MNDDKINALVKEADKMSTWDLMTLIAEMSKKLGQRKGMMKYNGVIERNEVSIGFRKGAMQTKPGPTIKLDVHAEFSIADMDAEED